MYPAEDGLYVGFKERGSGVEEEMIAIPEHCSSKVEKMVLGGGIFQIESNIFFENNFITWV